MSVAIEDVSFRYGPGGAGVDGVTLPVETGAFCAVIGPSGCGKSTLLKLVGGFLFPDRGVITIAGRDMGRLPPAGRELGVVFQSYALFPHMSALENVAYPLKLRGVPAAERRRRAGEALERAGLGALLDRAPGQLSGGQQQRVALARALVFRPRALLLDEPLSALDAAQRAAMRDEIRAVQREHSIATLLVTHDQEEALSIADTVAVMADGRLLQHAAPRDLYDRPVNRFVAGFVGHANLFDGVVRGPALVETPLGPLACAAHGHAAGAPVTVLIRPEAVQPLPAGAAGPEVNRFRGRVVRDRFLGALRRFDLGVAGGILVGETASRDAVATVHVAPDRVLLLPADPIQQTERPAP